MSKEWVAKELCACMWVLCYRNRLIFAAVDVVQRTRYSTYTEVLLSPFNIISNYTCYHTTHTTLITTRKSGYTALQRLNF